MREPISPGELLQKEFLDPHGMSRKKLAVHLGWNVKRIDRICNNQSSITPEIALTLESAFGMPAQFWLDSQTTRDLWLARRDFKSINRLPCVRHFSPPIEKNIPIKGTRAKQRDSKYKFHEMEIGDSILFKCDTSSKDDIHRTRSKITSNVLLFRRKNVHNENGLYKFKTRTVKNGIRVWRIK